MIRPEKEIAAEIGRQIIDAADSIRKYCPDCQAIVTFELDGMDFVAIVRDKPGKSAYAILPRQGFPRAASTLLSRLCPF